jgi:protein-disulfide isomerase
MKKYIEMLKKFVADDKTDYEILKAVLREYNIHPGTCPVYHKADKEAMQFILDDIAIIRKNIKNK